LTRFLVIPVATIFLLPTHVAAALVMLVQEALTVILLTSIVLAWEGYPLRSIGVRFPRAIDVPCAMATAAASISLTALIELYFLFYVLLLRLESLQLSVE